MYSNHLTRQTARRSKLQVHTNYSSNLVGTLGKVYRPELQLWFDVLMAIHVQPVYIVFLENEQVALNHMQMTINL